MLAIVSFTCVNLSISFFPTIILLFSNSKGTNLLITRENNSPSLCQVESYINASLMMLPKMMAYFIKPFLLLKHSHI